MKMEQWATTVLAACFWLLPAASPSFASGNDQGEMAAYAVGVEKDLASLDGDWEGQNAGGTRIAVHFTAAKGSSVPLTGRWKIEGGSFAGDADVSLLRVGSSYFLLPEASPLVAPVADTDAKGAYTMMRLPTGGLRFVRLARLSLNGQLAWQTEEVVIGKKLANGSRTLKFTTSERLCGDSANPAGKACGEAVSEQITLRKANAST